MTAWYPALARIAVAGLFAVVLIACPERMSDAEKHSRDGNDLFRAGNYAAAEEAFDRVVSLRSGEPGPLVNRGNARMMLDRTEEAMADYDAAVRADPRFGKAYANRGILKDRLGDEEGAVEDYRRALELEPGLAEGPSLWQRVLHNPPTETIRHRLRYLESKHARASEAPMPE